MKKYFSLLAVLFLFVTCEKEEIDNSFREEVLAEVNALRESGCNCGADAMPATTALEWDEKLEAAAKRHSEDMEKNSNMSHVGSDGSIFSERITDAGYQWTTCAENIASGYTSVKDVIEGWKNSEGHCKNMMAKAYKHVAVYRSGNYWTMCLGNN